MDLKNMVMKNYYIFLNILKKNNDCKSEPISYEGKRLSEYEKKIDD